MWSQETDSGGVPALIPDAAEPEWDSSMMVASTLTKNMEIGGMEINQQVTWYLYRSKKTCFGEKIAFLPMVLRISDIYT